jgi:hypothetical protein
MFSPRRNTSTSLRVPSVLAVGCAPELVARCRAAAVSAGVTVNECGIDLAATFAVERQPKAIVLPNEVYARHSRAVDTFARAVKATVVQVDASVTKLELGAMIAGAIQTGMEREEGRANAGRYSIIPGRSEETSALVQSQRPAPFSVCPPASSQPPATGDTEPAYRSGVRSQLRSNPGEGASQPSLSLSVPSRALRSLIAGS